MLDLIPYMIGYGLPSIILFAAIILYFKKDKSEEKKTK